MAKSKKSKKVAGKQLSPAQKAAQTRARNKAIAEAKATEQRYRRSLSSKISYRNKRLREDVSILPEDDKQRKRYLKELRRLYKEQNPKKNKALNKPEQSHYQNFRSAAKVKLKNLLSVSDEKIDGMSKKEKAKHVKLVNYYQDLISKTVKILKEDEKEPEEEMFDQEGEPVELLEAPEEYLLSFQMHDLVVKATKNEFFKKVTLFIREDVWRVIEITDKNRLTIGIEIQEFTGYIRRHLCATTPRYDYEEYTDGSIIVTAYCSGDSGYGENK